MAVRKPSIKINAISNWVVLCINIVVGFLLTPYIINHLGRTGYGIWTLVGSFVGYYGLLNLGVGSAVTRYVARYAGTGDEKSLNETASTAITVFTFTGILVIIISFLIADPLAKFFEVEPQHFEDFIFVIRIIGLATGLSFSGNMFGAIIRAQERFIAANSASLTVIFVRTGLVVYLLYSGRGLLGIAFATLGGEFIRFTANYILCRILFPSIHIRFRLARLKVLRKLILYGGVTTVIVIADIMRGNLDSFVIGKWVNLPAVGIYGIAVTIIHYIINIVTTGMGVLTPRFAALDGKGDHVQARCLLVKALAVSSFLSFGGYMMAIIFGKQFILWWVGKDFSDSVTILWILSFSGVFAIAQNPAIGFMYALNKHNFYAIATIIEAIANLTLSIILVSKYGIVGVALGTIIPMLIVKILIMPAYVSRIAGLSIRQYIRPLIPPAIVVCIIIGAAYYMGIITKNNTTTGSLIGSGIIVGIIYIATYHIVMRKYNPYNTPQKLCA